MPNFYRAVKSEMSDMNRLKDDLRRRPVFQEEAVARHPDISLSVLHAEEAQQQFRGALDWALQQITSNQDL